MNSQEIVALDLGGAIIDELLAPAALRAKPIEVAA